LDAAEEVAVTNHEQTVQSLTELLTTTQEENQVLGASIASLTTKIDTEQGRVDDATTAHGDATARHGLEGTRYATFLEELKADNERIEFELGVLDRAETILSMEGISRSEF